MTTLTTLSNLQVYLALIITGLCTGLGSAIGSYLANKGLISRLERKLNKIKKKK